MVQWETRLELTAIHSLRAFIVQSTCLSAGLGLMVLQRTIDRSLSGETLTSK